MVPQPDRRGSPFPVRYLLAGLVVALLVVSAARMLGGQGEAEGLTHGELVSLVDRSQLALQEQLERAGVAFDSRE